MSWKGRILLINDAEEGYLTTLPPHQEALAREWISKLELGPSYESKPSDLDQGFHPPQGWFCLGAYDRAVVICGELVRGMIEQAEHPLLKNALKYFPEATILVLELDGVTNSFGYSIHRRGKELRALAADRSRGVYVDRGEIQSEEAVYFRTSYLKEGVRHFRCQILGKMQEFDIYSFGEKLAFEVSQQILGMTFDTFAHEELKTELFGTEKPSWTSSIKKKLGMGR
jgi:hypothetical protein